ncbi:AraC family transcriptional regulator [Paenibacillus xylanexedens]|uniref:AraC family transcriptional regulator n=1 Tax=Paenibacillus xylanexedens TaxID=528191 RepID=UPI003B02CE24
MKRSQLADSRHFRLLVKMMWWIEKHLDYEIRLGKMAADVHLSKSYASRIFHQETGSSITDYVTARRLKQDYLRLDITTFSVEEIGRHARFPNGCISSNYFENLPGRARCIIGNNLNGAASINLVCKIIALLRLYIQLVFTV